MGVKLDHVSGWVGGTNADEQVHVYPARSVGISLHFAQTVGISLHFGSCAVNGLSRGGSVPVVVVPVANLR